MIKKLKLALAEYLKLEMAKQVQEQQAIIAKLAVEKSKISQSEKKYHDWWRATEKESKEASANFYKSQSEIYDLKKEIKAIRAEISELLQQQTK